MKPPRAFFSFLQAAAHGRRPEKPLPAEPFRRHARKIDPIGSASGHCALAHARSQPKSLETGNMLKLYIKSKFLAARIAPCAASAQDPEPVPDETPAGKSIAGSEGNGKDSHAWQLNSPVKNAVYRDWFDVF
jgi:hypothetical protein